MATISINGTVISGRNLHITGNKIMVDGVEVNPASSNKYVEVRILEGSVENLSSEISVCAQNVKGSVTAGTSVKCENVGGSVAAGTSVNCGRVGGSVAAGTSIRHA